VQARLKPLPVERLSDASFLGKLSCYLQMLD
jgi:hypothetical protein